VIEVDGDGNAGSVTEEARHVSVLFFAVTRVKLLKDLLFQWRRVRWRKVEERDADLSGATEGSLCPFHASRRVGSDKNKRSCSSSHVLWIGTDRDPFVFALSSCSGVRPPKHRTRVLPRLSSDNPDNTRQAFKECGKDISKTV